ncbi:MAG: hypothetical protein H0Z24_05905 [Thermosipho sp. (in: Bacteria)]|nr:hypothetical protein [Thermosipho sp. (in: thermotogales)]
MIKVMNKLRQPLAITLDDGNSIIFLAREKKDLTTEQYNSTEVQKHINLGNLIVLEIVDSQ